MYAQMLPRLEAEQTLRVYKMAVLANEMSVPEHNRAEILDTLERQMTGALRPRRADRMTFAAMGVDVVIEEGGDDG